MSSEPSVRIADRLIGRGAPAFVIAEVGVNHNGDPALASQLIAAAAAAGADAVKFQTFVAERLVSRSAEMAQHQRRAAQVTMSQIEMLSRLELGEQAHRALAAQAAARGVLFLSTPYDEQSADLLERLEVPAFKVASCDLTNLPLLRHVAKKGCPMIISTGGATLGEIEEALGAVRTEGNEAVILMHCTATYPARYEDCHLRAMDTLWRAFRRPVGYSDHTPGVEVAIAAVARGARVLEKHFTLSRTLPGPDHAVSLEPEEFAGLVRQVRNCERALGLAIKAPTAAELENRATLWRSLVAAVEISAGTVLTADMIAVKRPGQGLRPRELDRVVGRRTTRAIARDEPITWEAL